MPRPWWPPCRSGVEADRLEAEGYGSQHPVASNATPEGRGPEPPHGLRVLDKGDGEADDLLNELAGDTGSGDVLDTAQAQADFAKQNPLFAVMRPAVFQATSGGYNLGQGAGGR